MENFCCEADPWWLVRVAFPKGEAKTENSSFPEGGVESPKGEISGFASHAASQRFSTKVAGERFKFRSASQRFKIHQAVSFGPNILAVHTKMLSSVAGEALHPSGGSFDMDFRSESSRRVAGLQVGLDIKVPSKQAGFHTTAPREIVPSGRWSQGIRLISLRVNTIDLVPLLSRDTSNPLGRN